jgi:hypothetical protein
VNLPSFFVAKAPGVDVDDLRDCAFLLEAALGLVYFLLRGGSSDCVLVGVSIQSVGVAQLVAIKIPSSKPGDLCGALAQANGEEKIWCWLLTSTDFLAISLQ